jgi:hypothetical protein
VTSTCARGLLSGAWRRVNGFVGEQKSGQIWYDLIIESYLSHLASRFLCVYLSMGFNVSICLSIYIMLAIYTYLFIPSSIYLHILVYNRLYRQFEQDCVDTSVVFPIASRSPLPPGPEARGPRRLSCSWHLRWSEFWIKKNICATVENMMLILWSLIWGDIYIYV